MSQNQVYDGLIFVRWQRFSMGNRGQHCKIWLSFSDSVHEAPKRT